MNTQHIGIATTSERSDGSTDTTLEVNGAFGQSRVLRVCRCDVITPRCDTGRTLIRCAEDGNIHLPRILQHNNEWRVEVPSLCTPIFTALEYSFEFHITRWCPLY